MVDRKETGNDGVLIVGGEEVPFTNCSWDDEIETSEADFNDEFPSDIAQVSASYSGSFEYSGSNAELRSRVRQSDGRAKRVRLIVEESERKIRFEEVICSLSRDIPGGDRTTSTWDFVAENKTEI